MQQELKSFFDANEHWLAAVLKDGVRAGVFHFREPIKERAQLLLGALEGAMLVARSYDNPRRFQSAAVIRRRGRFQEHFIQVRWASVLFTNDLLR